MLHLCFADDIRNAEVDKNLVGTSFPEPTKEQVREAERLVEKLTIQDGYVGMYENPLLQRHYQVCKGSEWASLCSKKMPDRRSPICICAIRCERHVALALAFFLKEACICYLFVKAW